MSFELHKGHYKINEYCVNHEKGKVTLCESKDKKLKAEFKQNRSSLSLTLHAIFCLLNEM